MAEHLADLVREQRALLRLSYERLEIQCIDPTTGEQGVKGSWLHRLETGQSTKAPSLGQLRALAVGLKVSRSAVGDAAAGQYFDVEPR